MTTPDDATTSPAPAASPEDTENTALLETPESIDSSEVPEPEEEIVAAATTSEPRRLRWFDRHSEVIVVVLLGLVSVATAYTSFQAALYGGQSSDKIAAAGAAQTEAESLYLEGNQQYVQDNQIVLQLAELKLDAQSQDDVTATDSQDKYDELYFIGVSDDLDKAIKAAEKLDASEPDYYHSPLDDEDYQASLFGDYADKADEATTLDDAGQALGDKGDLLGFATALMAITLFLLGVAAVVKRVRTRLVLVAIGMVIFTATSALTASVPFTWIGW